MHNAIFFTCLVHYRHPAEVVRVPLRTSEEGS